MALALRNRQGSELVLVENLIEGISSLARRSGITRQDLWNIWHANEDIVAFAQAIPSNIQNAVNNWLQTFAAEEHALGHGHTDLNRKYPRGGDAPLSLSNSPHNEQDDPMPSEPTSFEGGNEGGAQEGGEPQAKKPRYIWTHFPNTETAKLRWIQSRFIGQISGINSFPEQQRIPFACTQQQTTTSLATGNGGAWSDRHPGLYNNLQFVENPGWDFRNPYMIQLKMTTPYGIIKKFGNDPNTTTAQPTWLEYFDSKYTYYHCMETRWKMTFNFGSVMGNPSITGAGNTIAQGYYIFWKYTSMDDPNTQYIVNERTIRSIVPVGGTGIVNDNEQIQTSNTSLAPADVHINYTADDYLRQGNWHHKHIRLSWVKGDDNSVTISGTYKFGQCKMDIKTLSNNVDGSNAPSAEGWNEVGSQAHFPENLSIVICLDNAMDNGNDKVVVGTRMETDQIIQFKDLRKVYKFPDPGMAKYNSGGQYLNTDAAFFMRGAAHG